MTSFRRGDVVLVTFPFTDAVGARRRPALVVSSDDYNAKSPDVIIASITGHLDAVKHPGDHVIAGWQEAGLARESLAQAKLATVEAGMIDRRLGALERDDLEVVERGLRSALALWLLLHPGWSFASGTSAVPVIDHHHRLPPASPRLRARRGCHAGRQERCGHSGVSPTGTSPSRIRQVPARTASSPCRASDREPLGPG
jgi:mRNA interferase MazF